MCEPQLPPLRIRDRFRLSAQRTSATPRTRRFLPSGRRLRQASERSTRDSSPGFSPGSSDAPSGRESAVRAAGGAAIAASSPHGATIPQDVTRGGRLRGGGVPPDDLRDGRAARPSGPLSRSTPRLRRRPREGLRQAGPALAGRPGAPVARSPTARATNASTARRPPCGTTAPGSVRPVARSVRVRLAARRPASPASPAVRPVPEVPEEGVRRPKVRCRPQASAGHRARRQPRRGWQPGLSAGTASRSNRGDLREQTDPRRRSGRLGSAR